MHDSSSTPSNAGDAGAAHAPVPSFSGAATGSPATTHDWTCPFCPLLCDDISIDLRGDNTLAASNTDCPRLARSIAHFSATAATCRPSVDGQDTDLESALARAGEILSRARRPLFGGLATDVAGARALYELAARCGAILDHLHGDALFASTLALQDRGAFFTTLSEVRSRADLLIVFGCQPSARYPRFYERALRGLARPLGVCFVACEADPAASALPNASVDSILPQADPFDVLAVWSALAEGRRIESGKHAEIADLAQRVASSSYTVVVYEPAALPGPHAALLVEALNRIVKAVNRTTRAGGLALGGDDGALTVSQAVTWLSGFALRTRVSMRAPLDYDPYRYRTQTLLAGGEADALLWVASFVPQPLPDALGADVPAIVLGHPSMAGTLGTRRAPTVFIPVATPGVDSGGHLFRIDATVVAPLRAARHAPLPGVAEIAGRLAAARSQP